MLWTYLLNNNNIKIYKNSVVYVDKNYENTDDILQILANVISIVVLNERKIDVIRFMEMIGIIYKILEY